MTDTVDRATRARMMSGIRGSHTGPERIVRSALHRQGFRFRLNVAGLPGRPDLVFPKHRAAVFVHGCFWHRHHGCRFATTPASNREFWLGKLQGNAKRDVRNRRELETLGWRVAVVWECALKDERAQTRLARLGRWLSVSSPFLEVEGR